MAQNSKLVTWYYTWEGKILGKSLQQIYSRHFINKMYHFIWDYSRRLHGFIVTEHAEHAKSWTHKYTTFQALSWKEKCYIFKYVHQPLILNIFLPRFHNIQCIGLIKSTDIQVSPTVVLCSDKTLFIPCKLFNFLWFGCTFIQKRVFLNVTRLQILSPKAVYWRFVSPISLHIFICYKQSSLESE